jgi:glycosyltransferase involved in cell wall biosynthesis
MDKEINGVSVILCCYNSASRLPETLKYLASQKTKSVFPWEIILVNNNATDNTVEKAVSIWETLGEPVTMQVVDEPNPGLSFAREKGMAIASYTVFLFCDDDNWLHEDYVETVFANFSENPKLGAVGGWSEAVFEAEKPEWFDVFSGNFAVGKPVPETGLLDKANQFIYGAGLALRKDAIHKLKDKGFKNILTDRKGTQLSSGGDIEFIYGLKLIDIPVMFDEALFFYHYMPEARMQWEYVIKLRTSMYWSNFVLSIYLDAFKNKETTGMAILKKIKTSIAYIYTKNKKINGLETNKALFLKNKIEVKKLFLNHIYFYFKTSLALKKIKHG